MFRLAVRVDLHRHERHVAVVVDLRKAHQLRFGDLANRIHETEVTAFVGQSVEEIAFHVGVFGANRANRHRRAIRQNPFLDQMVGVGVDRHVGVTIHGRRCIVDHDTCIGGDHALVVDDQRVDVELDDLRNFADHIRHMQQQIVNGVDIGRRHRAVGFEHVEGARTLDQTFSQHLVQRRQCHAAIRVQI